nr:cytochrome c oxidase subunit II [Paenibacillus psychroresistens]
MMNRFKFVKRILPLLGMLALLLTGCGDPNLSALHPRGPVAREQLDLVILSLGIMIFVLVIVFAIYFYVLIRFRKRKGDESIPEQVEGNHVLEIIWTVVPIILLLIIAVPTVQYTFKHATDYRKDKDAVHIQVVGHQFWWQFKYGDYEINTAQEILIPIKKHVSFEINSGDVNHSFWVPSLGGKIDSNPGDGSVNILYLEADEPGIYEGKCAELCGASHTLMDFKVKAVTQAEFDAWIQKMKAPLAAVPADALAGEAIFKENCLQCHAIESNGAGFGPNLNGFANRIEIAGILDRKTPEESDANLLKWIENPNDVKPGTLMPQVIDKATDQPLGKDKIAELIKYLNTLK